MKLIISCLALMVLAGCDAATCVGNGHPPETNDCAELEALTIPLCEQINQHNSIAMDCRASFFGSMTRSCSDVVMVKEQAALIGDCLPKMRAAQAHFFPSGGGWYDWPESCQDQFVYEDQIQRAGR